MIWTAISLGMQALCRSLRITRWHPDLRSAGALCEARGGKGLAFEAAAAALKDIFIRTEMTEVLSFTAPDNVRSQALMRRLELKRDAGRDFIVDCDGVPWWGLVWVAERQDLLRAGSAYRAALGSQA
jgi:RimJ/RimL family protein N-acetyltransferase